ncbi:uncharacterized protein K452DRAFT_265384 [Aplosporella prunicola CBS 121167]|uniref:Cytochrome P450 n=1 Tax=Aplosporella prunicola CBS 121167 TaxID=1176127 RepID=A0A6A6BLL3_9PEZI|nr:uncharacterized protein K452DRAFT_265384 [Aplosporella prunicola CBS 121167]KAF2144926.1 hypothetical protein K452DRAFT_265384 [Aplosporella prunicola CBS 121167]
MDTVRNIPTFLPEILQARIESYGSSGKIPVVPIAAALLAISYLFILYFQRPRALQAPLLRAELSEKERQKTYLTDSVSLLAEGYRKFKNGIYRLTTTDGVESVILSAKYLDELKNASDDVVNFPAAINVLLAGKYSGISGDVNALAQHVIRSDLTPSLGRLQANIAEEVDLALERFLPACEDWTTIKVHQALLNIIAEVSARMFVGAPLCRNQRWIELSRDYTLTAFSVARAMRQWKPWMRPFVQYFTPELRQLKKVRQEAVKFMMPVTKERSETEIKNDDMTQWMKAKSSPSWAKDYEGQAALQVQLAMAAIHTTTMGATHMLYDLFARPEYVEPLREEIQTVLAETGGFTKDTMAKLKKLDSFLKESQRMSPPGVTTFKRRIMRDLTLSDGTFLPEGTLVEVDTVSRTKDPALVDEADKFDGMRYYNLRENATTTRDAHMHQFVTSNSSSMHWGAGRHACPGRFFASTEIKTIVAKMLLAFDMKLADEAAGRPKNFHFGVQVTPDSTAEALFKKRRAAA